jgi:hypothetical protein
VLWVPESRQTSPIGQHVCQPFDQLPGSRAAIREFARIPRSTVGAADARGVRMLKTFARILLLLVPAAASAQPETNEGADTSAFDHAVAPVKNALEIGVATGYTQGAGKLGGGMNSLEDLARAGGAVEVDIGARIFPNLSVGAYGTFSQSAKGDQVASSTDVFGASAGVQATWHFRPDTSVDPYVNLGGGWRGLWLNPSSGKTTSLQGLELARLQVGVDYRITPDVAVSPLIGAALDMFVSQDSPMTTDYTEIGSKKVNFSGFAGIAGRFDLGGKR